VWLGLVLRGGAARAAHRWRSARLGPVEPALTFALFDIGIDRTGAADAAVLVAAQSIFTVALSGLVLRERTTARVGAAVALGFAGVVVVGSDGSGHGATVLGDVLVLASSAAAAVAAILAGGLPRRTVGTARSGLGRPLRRPKPAYAARSCESCAASRSRSSASGTLLPSRMTVQNFQPPLL
jgi:drug/metabolite transporter (DMT)-like permease